MRRGFYGWDAGELPLATLEARTRRLQDAMRVEKLDGLMLYTNIARPAAVSWLTGFTPYWSEGLLFVPKAGAPDFATALSNRVAEWMRAVTPTGSILCTPQPAKFFGERLAKDAGAKRLGILELDMLPGGQAAALMAAAPELELIDATHMFRRARAIRDDAELALFAQAGLMARGSFAAIASMGDARAHEAMGAVEKAARHLRAEEVYIAIAPDLARDANFVRVDRASVVGASFALRASIAYKSTWVRMTRSFSSDAGIAARFAELEGTFDACLNGLDGKQSLAGQIEAAFAAHAGVRLAHWSLEACIGSYPLEFIAGDGEAIDACATDGSVVGVNIALDGLHWLGQQPVQG